MKCRYGDSLDRTAMNMQLRSIAVAEPTQKEFKAGLPRGAGWKKSRSGRMAALCQELPSVRLRCRCRMSRSRSWSRAIVHRSANDLPVGWLALRG